LPHPATYLLPELFVGKNEKKATEPHHQGEAELQEARRWLSSNSGASGSRFDDCV